MSTMGFSLRLPGNFAHPLPVGLVEDAKELIDLDIDKRMTNAPAPASLVSNSFANAALEIKFLRVRLSSPSIFLSGWWWLGA